MEASDFQVAGLPSYFLYKPYIIFSQETDSGGREDSILIKHILKPRQTGADRRQYAHLLSFVDSKHEKMQGV